MVRICSFAPVAQWIEQWFPVPCAGVRFPSGVLPGTIGRSGALYYKEDKNLDNFREWLSDNLRYFMLGGAILLIVVALFFGIRACVGTKKGNSDQDADTQQTTTDNNQGNVPSSPAKDGETDGKKDANPMETGNEEITSLIKSYFKALGGKDIATLRTLVDDLAPSDESKITNAKEYIEGYEVDDVYTKKGMEDDTYVVYACFYYICQGIDTKVPALTQFYVFKDSEGSLKIDGAAYENAKITAYMDDVQADEDVQKLIKEREKLYEEAQEQDADLAAFLDGLGEDAGTTTVADGTVMVVTEDCNVRAEADGEVIGGLAAGTEVEKKGQSGEWYQIEYEGQDAYVHSSLLEEKTE